MRLIQMCSLGAVLAFEVSCTKSSETANESKNANEDVKVTTVEELNLAAVLQLQIPDSIAGKGGASLTEGSGKSFEACLMRSTMKQSIQMLSGLANTLCHIQAESKSIQFGKPVLLKLGDMPAMPLQGPDPEIPMPTPGGNDPNITMPTGTPAMDTPPGDPNADAPAAPEMGPMYMGVFIDNKHEESTDVYICTGTDKAKMKLTQSFSISAADKRVIDGKSTPASKGFMSLLMEMGEMNFGASIKFDSRFRYADQSTMEMRVKMSGKMAGQDNTYNQLLNLQLIDKKASFIQVSDSGTMFGGDTRNVGAARFDDKNGNVIYSLNQTHAGQKIERETEACVDDKGTIVSCDDAKFKEKGDLYVAAVDVPGYLGDEFSPYKPAGFDCAKAEWGDEIALDPASTEHAACEKDQGSPFADENCFDDGFTKSETTVDLPEPKKLSAVDAGGGASTADNDNAENTLEASTAEEDRAPKWSTAAGATETNSDRFGNRTDVSAVSVGD